MPTSLYDSLERPSDEEYKLPFEVPPPPVGVHPKGLSFFFNQCGILILGGFIEIYCLLREEERKKGYCSSDNGSGLTEKTLRTFHNKLISEVKTKSRAGAIVATYTVHPVTHDPLESSLGLIGFLLKNGWIKIGPVFTNRRTGNLIQQIMYVL